QAALVGRLDVLHEQEGQARLGRQVAEQVDERLQPAGGGADPDDGEGRLVPGSLAVRLLEFRRLGGITGSHDGPPSRLVGSLMLGPPLWGDHSLSYPLRFTASSFILRASQFTNRV